MRVLLRLSAIAAVCLAALLASCQHPATDAGGDARMRVTQVADGDTITGRDEAGQRVRVRLLGIDAPEVAHDGRPDEWGADAARDSLRDLLLHRDVKLASDPHADSVDRFGRQLAYVDVAGVDAALHQVTTGYAEAWHPRGEPQPDREPSYQRAQRDAQRSNLGAWAHCPTLGR